MNLVVDASAIVHRLVDVPFDPALDDLLGTGELHAPSLIDYEVVSAVRGHVRARKVTPRRAEHVISTFRDLTVYRHDMTAALVEMLRYRDNFTAYDAAYIVLARILDAPLLTTDAKQREAQRLGVTVQIFGAD